MVWLLRFSFGNSTLPDRNFGVDFDGGDSGDNDDDGRDGDASDEGDGGENGIGGWHQQQWRKNMQGAVAGWFCLSSGSFSYLV